MTSGEGNIAERAASTVLDVLASLYRCRKEIYWILKSNPLVAAVTRDGGAQRSNDSEGPEYLVDVFAEATTHGGDSFCWLVIVQRRSSGWELYRAISGSEATVRKFEDGSFKTFDELAASYSALLDEFIESARTFDFDHPQGSVADGKSA